MDYEDTLWIIGLAAYPVINSAAVRCSSAPTNINPESNAVASDPP